MVMYYRMEFDTLLTLGNDSTHYNKLRIYINELKSIMEQKILIAQLEKDINFNRGYLGKDHFAKVLPRLELQLEAAKIELKLLELRLNDTVENIGLK